MVSRKTSSRNIANGTRSCPSIPSTPIAESNPSTVPCTSKPDGEMYSLTSRPCTSDNSERTSRRLRSLFTSRRRTSLRGSRTSLDNGREVSSPCMVNTPIREFASTGRCSCPMVASSSPTKSEYASVRIENCSNSSPIRADDSSSSV